MESAEYDCPTDAGLNVVRMIPKLEVEMTRLRQETTDKCDHTNFSQDSLLTVVSEWLVPAGSKAVQVIRLSSVR